ncbi:hypothetical protein ACC686_36150, partial [Rhizobium johnstonii]|uniref:hypothetical protein n=1 Tax=Rhizobium johnstonii TaxID=3019933 RepID=UPI003F96F14B
DNRCLPQAANAIRHFHADDSDACGRSSLRENAGKPAFSEHDPGLGRNPMEAVAGDGKTKNLK